MRFSFLNPRQRKLQSMRVDMALVSDRGKVRRNNEDSGIAINRGSSTVLSDADLLIVVADGMGGHVGGEKASQLAVDIIPRSYYLSNGSSSHALREAVVIANEEIHRCAVDEPQYQGMGTTVVALALHKGRISIAHVGDSRIYRYCNNSMQQVTRDHSMVADMLQQGLLNEDEARTHPDAHVILRALGTQPDIEVDVAELKPRGCEEVFILCSDGLTDLVSDKEIAHAITRNARESCTSLLNLALMRGGRDNITIAILRLYTVQEAAPFISGTREIDPGLCDDKEW